MRKLSHSEWILFISGLSLAVLSSLPAKADFPACPQNQTAEELEKWRKAAIGSFSDSNQPNSVKLETDTASKLASSIESCFPTKIPACLQRVHDYAEQKWVAILPMEPDTPEDRKRRVLPKEFWDESAIVNGEPTKFSFFKQNPDGNGYEDIEQIAREKGWPMVRYKTRMSGGFDSTTSLLMIRVPGNKLTPPVDYDQYVNIPIPRDPADEEGPIDQVKSVPQHKFPGPDDYRDPNKAIWMPSTVTVVTVEKKEGNKPAKVYFTAYHRENAGSFTLFRTPQLNKLECYSCHPNGVRAISPYGYNVREAELAHGIMKPEAEWIATQEMNNSMNRNNGFGIVDWGKVKDPSGKLHPVLNTAAMGPALGPIHPLNHKVITGEDGRPKTIYPTRTKEFIVGEDGKGGCSRNFSWTSNWTNNRAYGLQGNQISLRDHRNGPSMANVFTMTDNPPINWEKVRDQMNCASCHNNRIRGSLNEQTSFTEVAFKILVDQSMPVGAHSTSPAGNGSVHDDLNPNERIALTNCLKAEFDIERKMTPEWLSQVSCSNDQNANVTSAINGMFPQPTVGSHRPVPRQGVSNRRTPVSRPRHGVTSETPASSNGRAN